MFNLTKRAAKIAHLNIREEIHGEDKVLAEDIKIQADVPNDFLVYLSPTLKWSLYEKADDTQGNLIEDDTHFPRLRYSRLSPLHWSIQMPNASFSLHGAKKSDSLELTANIDKLLLDCKEGGTVAITFRVSVYPTAQQSGFLASLLGQEVCISVSPGEDNPELGGSNDAE